MTNNYTEQIASLLSGKLEIQNVSEEVIQIMLQEHPYSPYGHLVNYLKAKSQRRDDTEALLHKLATYSPDRAWLQQILSTTFKDIETQAAQEQAIPSEAKDPNLDKMLFEFDFNLPTVEAETKTVGFIDSFEIEEPATAIPSEYQEVIFVEKEEAKEADSKVTQAAPNSYIGWLQSFKSELEEPQVIQKEELPVENQRLTEIKAPVIEKTTRKDNDLFGGIITETLAELLANQGQTEKAISMYERLTLIFPNKSAFFAAKIEQLKHNIT